jgi:2-keto-4-pentenoate hydratase/2-oxohepta-3-ene-1,7-dioic acid hydratase in catechol pathway
VQRRAGARGGLPAVKLVTFQTIDGEERLGALRADGGLLDLTKGLPERAFASMMALIDAGEEAWAEARRFIAADPLRSRLAASDFALRAPLPLPRQFRDSMSFHKHIRQAQTSRALQRARESGDARKVADAERYAATYELPEIYRQQPVYYKANRFSVCGPGEEVPWPRYSKHMDFELELACIIGRKGKDIAKENAHSYIFGYTIFDDFSARDAQAQEMDGRLGPAKGKDFDKGNALGPCLVTADEIGDAYALRMQARVNGETWCDSSSSTMYWRFDDLLAHISADETIYPGEVIGSGTVGDGCGLEHGRLLKHGDVVELEIEKIGVLCNRVVRQDF